MKELTSGGNDASRKSAIVFRGQGRMEREGTDGLKPLEGKALDAAIGWITSQGDRDTSKEG
jgi:hypothetical protein